MDISVDKHSKETTVRRVHRSCDLYASFRPYRTSVADAGTGPSEPVVPAVVSIQTFSTEGVYAQTAAIETSEWLVADTSVRSPPNIFIM